MDIQPVGERVNIGSRDVTSSINVNTRTDVEEQIADLEKYDLDA